MTPTSAAASTSARSCTRPSAFGPITTPATRKPTIGHQAEAEADVGDDRAGEEQRDRVGQEGVLHRRSAHHSAAREAAQGDAGALAPARPGGLGSAPWPGASSTPPGPTRGSVTEPDRRPGLRTVTGGRVLLPAGDVERRTPGLEPSPRRAAPGGRAGKVKRASRSTSCRSCSGRPIASPAGFDGGRTQSGRPAGRRLLRRSRRDGCTGAPGTSRTDFLLAYVPPDTLARAVSDDGLDADALRSRLPLPGARCRARLAPPRPAIAARQPRRRGPTCTSTPSACSSRSTCCAGTARRRCGCASTAAGCHAPSSASCSTT